MARMHVSGHMLPDVVELTLPPSTWAAIEELRTARMGAIYRDRGAVEYLPVVDAAGRRKQATTRAGRCVRTLVGANPRQSLASFVREFIQENAATPIVYPSPQWLRANGEGTGRGGRRADDAPCMISRTVNIGTHAWRILSDRAQSEGKPASLVLRRLLRQAVDNPV